MPDAMLELFTALAIFFFALYVRDRYVRRAKRRMDQWDASDHHDPRGPDGTW